MKRWEYSMGSSMSGCCERMRMISFFLPVLLRQNPQIRKWTPDLLRHEPVASKYAIRIS
jgi:hypothetical protein